MSQGQIILKVSFWAFLHLGVPTCDVREKQQQQQALKLEG